MKRTTMVMARAERRKHPSIIDLTLRIETRTSSSLTSLPKTSSKENSPSTKTREGLPSTAKASPICSIWRDQPIGLSWSMVTTCLFLIPISRLMLTEEGTTRLWINQSERGPKKTERLRKLPMVYTSRRLETCQTPSLTEKPRKSTASMVTFQLSMTTSATFTIA